MYNARAVLGRSGENVAVSWLMAHGYEILDRNWRYGKWELDIICCQAGVIHFVEVKTRSGSAFGGAVRAVGQPQRRRLLLAAQAWLAARELWNSPCQFDVICLTGSGKTLRVERYADAFSWEIMGSSDAHWQHW